MLSLAKAGKDYYLQKVGEISPREDYYLKGGFATGHWHGGGAAELGLEGTVNAEGLVRLFDGQHPATGEQLGHKLRRDGVAAWDLTFSADKSVSLLWAFGDAETRKHVVEAFEEATTEAVIYMESVASSTRGAARTPVVDRDGQPILGEDGAPRYRTETWPIRTSGYVSARFTEFTSRADDPQLHTHVVVGNRVKGVDGVWRAIDGRLLYRNKLAAGYLHEAELRSRLTERLGVRWQPVRNGMADIDGFTREQIMAFSNRRLQIEAWRESHGIADTAAGNETATLATRSPKNDYPLSTLMPEWMERAAEVGLTHAAVSATLDRGYEVAATDYEPLPDRLASANGLTAEVSTFGRAEVIKATAEALPDGGKRRDVEAVADRFLRRPDVVPILPSQPTIADLSELPIDLSPSDFEHLKELAEAVESSKAMRRKDGTIFPGLIHERRYTTTELLKIEQRIVARAIAGVTATRWTTPQARVDAVLSNNPALTEGQRAMVHQFSTSGNAIEVAVGAAGTGKTTVMAIIHELAFHDGVTVIGAALAARAAAGFETATGIRSSTLARLLREARETGGLPDGTVVVVDEAGMVGSRHLAEVSDLVEAASGKLILIGDHHQLAEIDAGGLFRALVVRAPAIELTENVRQESAWERTALAELRHGSITRAIAIYDQHARIKTAATTDDLINQAVKNWYQDIQAVADPAEVLLVGHRNTTVDLLNQRARSLIADAGLLEGPSLTVDDRAFTAGDRVVCLKNRSRLGVLNGDLATVTTVDTDHRALTIRLDRNDQMKVVPHWYLDDGHLDWAYALTGHKAQGATARRAHTVAGNGVDREWIYVTMSRGQEANTIYLEVPELQVNACTHLRHEHPERIWALIAALGRSGTEPAALDTGRGPRTLTDHQLRHRLMDLQAMLDPQEADQNPPVTRRDRFDCLAEYLTLHREAHARQRDNFATLAYRPPAWIVDTLGERPSEHQRRAIWDVVVDRALRYRIDQGIPDAVPDLLGSEPSNREADRLPAWMAARQDIERLLSDSRSREELPMIGHGR